MFFSQIRSHAQKYFLKVQKNGTDEYLPPPVFIEKNYTHSTQCFQKKLHTLHPVLTHYTQSILVILKGKGKRLSDLHL